MSPQPERRRKARIILPDRPDAMTQTMKAVRVIDMNALGVRIEHDTPFHSGADCTLKLPAASGLLTRAGRIIWCKPLAGSGPHRYESGVQFRGVL